MLHSSIKKISITRPTTLLYSYSHKTQASPELVLAVARESALLQAAQTVNPTEELIVKDKLRSGVSSFIIFNVFSYYFSIS